MDGLEATRAIREQPGPSGQVPIIAMTANAFATDRNACLEAGMNDFISKPITARKLFDAIEPWASGIAREDEQADADDTDDASLPFAPEEAAAPVAAPPIDPSLIDARQMGMIQDEVGTDGLHELLISFWADAAGLLAELEQALTAEDYRSASAVLHTLKGAAANLGLSGCGAACADARADIAEGRAPDVGELLTIMFKTLQATQPRIVEAAGAINAEAA
jgi:CheY-like chemotaxis protein